MNEQQLQRTQALKAIIAETEQEENIEKKEELISAATRAVEIVGRRKYFELRGKWSSWIVGWITGLIAFNSIITIAVGVGFLDYTKYEWFITVVLAETFLQIVGLGYVAVKYLFKDQ